MSAAAYLILLPCAVWLLGSILALLDRSDAAAAGRRIAASALPFLAAAALLGGGAATPALAAVATVLALHTAVAVGLRLAMRRGWLTRSSLPWWNE